MSWRSVSAWSPPLKKHHEERYRALLHNGKIDAAVEKHVPVWTVENDIVHVKVGSVEHPMLPEHYIEWVSLQTKQGNQRKGTASRREAGGLLRSLRGR